MNMNKNSGQIYIWVTIVIALLLAIAGAAYWLGLPIPGLTPTQTPISTQSAHVSTLSASKLQPQQPVVADTSSKTTETQLHELQDEIKRNQQELIDAQREQQQALDDMEALKKLIHDKEEAIKLYEAQIKVLKNKQ